VMCLDRQRLRERVGLCAQTRVDDVCVLFSD
jgi:hypothetical protein